MVRSNLVGNLLARGDLARRDLVGRTVLYVVAVGLLLGLMLSATGADEPLSPTNLQAVLDSGEYSLAHEAARQLPVDRRDGVYRELATAQIRVGAEQAAAASIAAIGEDQLRSRSFAELAAYITSKQTAAPAEVPNVPPTGAAGGGVAPDFDSLIDLITSTIRPNDWQDNGGTIGFIRAHDGGVYVDAAGVMKPLVLSADAVRLAALRRESAREQTPGGARRTSALRKISLTRLERELQFRRSLQQPLDEELRTLAGLQRVTHVFVYPETKDVVLAGPAGDWYLGRENRLLAVESDRPVVLLDDLVTLLRREYDVGGFFSCSIDPTADGLKNVRAFADSSRKQPLAPGGLNVWSNQLRDSLGRQDVVFRGIDPQSRVARTLVEADYHMKLVGIERAPSTLGVPSYFQIVRDSLQNKGQDPPSLGLLRWWFTVNYDALLTSPQHDVYELRGQGVQLLSEDEFLSAKGERVSTGKADDLNRQYAENFTQHYAQLSQKYPLYADLQNVFDLALVCSILKQDQVCERAGWQRLGLTDPRIVTPDRDVAPASVDSVANAALLTKSKVMAVISGGVRVDCSLVAQPSTMQIDDRGRLTKERLSAAPKDLGLHNWWWD